MRILFLDNNYNLIDRVSINSIDIIKTNVLESDSLERFGSTTPNPSQKRILATYYAGVIKDNIDLDGIPVTYHKSQLNVNITWILDIPEDVSYIRFK